MPKCTACSIEKQDDCFEWKTAQHDIRVKRCRECVEKRKRAKYWENPERNRQLEAAKRRRYTAKHREAVRAYDIEYRKKHPEKMRRLEKNRKLKQRFGIDSAGLERMRAAQGGRCAICEGTGGTRGLCVDHCPTTGRVRKLLCLRCNTGLGWFREDGSLMMRAIAYIQSHSPAP